MLSAELPRVAVIIPAYNEAAKIAETVRASKAIPGVDLIVVVDDGSQDQTQKLARQAGATTVRHTANRGIAAALETGARVVKMNENADAPAHLLLFMTGDMGESAAECAHLVAAVASGKTDCAIAALPDAFKVGRRYQAKRAAQAQMRSRGLEQQHAAPIYGPIDQSLRQDPIDEFIATARASIRSITGWQPTSPISRVRCMTRAAYTAALPLAGGCSAYPIMTIQILLSGFAVQEIPLPLTCRPRPRHLAGAWNRFQQFKALKLTLWRIRMRLSENEAAVQKPAHQPQVGEVYRLARSL